MNKIFFTPEELQKRISENDNRSTARPYLLLLNKKHKISADEDFSDEFEYVEHVTGDYLSFNTFEEAYSYLRNDYYFDDDFVLKDGDIKKWYYQEVQETVNVFLTDKGYQEHMTVNHHNIGEHDTYGIHAFRNKEIASMFNAIDEAVKLKKQVEMYDDFIMSNNLETTFNEWVESV